MVEGVYKTVMHELTEIDSVSITLWWRGSIKLWVVLRAFNQVVGKVSITLWWRGSIKLQKKEALSIEKLVSITLWWRGSIKL